MITVIRQFLLVFLVVLVVGVPASVFGQGEKPASNSDVFSKRISPFLKQYCYDCHGAEAQEGELRLDTIRADFVNRPFAGHWVEVLDRLNLNEMPPQDAAQPTGDEKRAVIEWLTDELKAARDRMESTGGRVVLRRLSRLEYANTVRDLLGVRFIEGDGPLEMLPPDGKIRGFDRNSKALLLDPSLMKSYFEVAESVAEAAVQFRPPLVAERTMRFHFKDTPDSAMSYLVRQRHIDVRDGLMELLADGARTFAKLRHPYNGKEVPVTGEYRVRIRAAAKRGPDDKPVFMDVKQGPGDRIARFQVDASKDSPKVYEFVTIRDEKFNGEYGVRIVNGVDLGRYIQRRGQQQRKADDLFKSGKQLEADRLRARLFAQGDFAAGAFRREAVRLEDAPRLYLDWIEVTGPLRDPYPPPSMKRLFPNGWDRSQQNRATARRAFQRLLPRAFRRRVTDAEVDGVMRVVDRELEAGVGFEQAMKSGLIAVLCSPDFVYLFEPSPKDTPQRTLTQFELATRISYFLWSTKPDETLFRAAARAELSKPEQLQQQVERMLGDARVEGMVQGFARQWLKVDEFARFLPDQQIFPEFYEPSILGVEEDLVEQPLAVFREMLRADVPILHIIDADWTMANRRLAAYYRLPWPKTADGAGGANSREFRRVSLPTSSAEDEALPFRGGLLGMAGVHLWGADGSRTKPVERGKYVLDVLFNDPPPPPPPNAGEVEPNVRGENLTVRERLQKHREQTTCQNCHRRIDPYGLALENFNAIGRWRTAQDGERPIQRWRERKPIDPSGQLPNGQSFTNVREYRQLLLKQSERIHRGIAEKLFSYALGRTVEPSDRGEIDDIVKNSQRSGGTWKALILAIVQSPSFGTK